MPINFYLAEANLGIRRTDENDKLLSDETYANASTAIVNGKLYIKEDGEVKATFKWSDDMQVDGSDTSGLQDAYDKINALGFNRGGTAPTYQVFRGIFFKEDGSATAPVLIENENTTGSLNVSRQSAGVYVISGFNLPTENNLQAYISSLVTDGKTVSVAVNDVDGEVVIQNRESGVLADENFRISLRIELTPP